MEELIQKVEAWAVDKGIDKPENWSKQYVKVVEELGELGSAILKNKPAEEVDGFGDVLVTIIILAMQRSINLEAALNAAYLEIAGRTGQTVGGVFVKS
jgi:NTP pyrophosphatase (non-canonical NTP hydrolase)